MKNLGFSITSHYRLIKDIGDISYLINLFVNEIGVNRIELGYFDETNIKMFHDAYISNQKILSKKGLNINLHLPRKNRDLIGITNILDYINELNEVIDIKNLIIHIDEYIKYASIIKKTGINIILENPHLEKIPIFEDTDINDDICCDINNFYDDGIYDYNTLNKFLLRYNKKIKEIHFSYQNHDIFDQTNISFLQNILINNFKDIDFDDIIFIFEGTDKNGNSLDVLKKSLIKNYNILCFLPL